MVSFKRKYSETLKGQGLGGICTNTIQMNRMHQYQQLCPYSVTSLGEVEIKLQRILKMLQFQDEDRKDKSCDEFKESTWQTHYNPHLSVNILLIIDLLLINLFLTHSYSYPAGPNIILTRNQQFFRDTYTIIPTDHKTATGIDGIHDDYYQSQTRNLSNFIASRHSYLQPLVSISEMDSYQFDGMSDLFVFNVEALYEANSPDQTLNKSYYKVRLQSMYSGNTMIKVRVDTMFFSKSLQSTFDNEVPLFYSFRVKSEQFQVIEYSGGSNQKIDQVIRLPLAVDDIEFMLPQNKDNYEIVGYLTAVDLNQSASCWSIGMVSTTTLTSQSKMNVKLQFGKINSCSPQLNTYLKSFSLNIFIYHRENVKMTEHFIEHKDVRHENVNVKYQSGQPSSMDISQCQYMIGLTGAFTNNAVAKTKFHYKAEQLLQSSNTTINFTLLNTGNQPLQRNTNEFVIFGKIRCKDGYFYNFLINSPACQSNSTWMTNYYIVENELYSQTTYLHCISGCVDDSVFGYYTCRDIYNISRKCKPCNDLNSMFNISSLSIGEENTSPTQQCKTCVELFAEDECVQCSVDDCLKCDHNLLLLDSKCTVGNICDDKKWTPEYGEECDTIYNTINSGCSPVFCKIQDGFTCQPSPYRWANEVSQCFYTRNPQFYYMQLQKVQFQNVLILRYFMKRVFWDNNQRLQKALTITAMQMDNITVTNVQFNYVTKQLSVQIFYDNCNILNSGITIQNNMLQMNQSQLISKYLSNQQRTTLINYHKITHAYFLNNHPEQYYQMAQILVVFFYFAGFIGLVFIVCGLIGGKFIAIEVVSLLQATYIGLLLVDKYTPLYLATNRLSLISGNFLYGNLNSNSQTANTYQYSQLNTLKLSTSFLLNCNLQLTLFILPLLLGLAFKVLERFNNPNKSIAFSIVSVNMLCQYSIYGLLVWGYWIPLSLGLQVKYQLISPIVIDDNTYKALQQQQPNIPSLVIGCLFLTVMLIYFILVLKYPNKFGQFYREMLKFAISQKLVALIILEKIIVGLGIGLFHQFRYIGIALAAFEIALVLLVRCMRPFYYGVHDNRLAFNHSFIAFILIVYNTQKLFYDNQQLTQFNPWFYLWPVAFILCIYLLLVKNMLALIKQIRVTLYRLVSLQRMYQEYIKSQEMKEQLIEDKNFHDNKLLIANSLLMEQGDQNFQLTKKQLQQWKNYPKVNTSQGLYDQMREKTKHNKYIQQQEELMNDSFRQKLTIRKIDKSIKKKIQSQKNSKDQNIQEIPEKQKQLSKQKQQQDNQIQQQQQEEENLSDRELLLNENQNVFNLTQQQQIQHLKVSQKTHQSKTNNQVSLNNETLKKSNQKIKQLPEYERDIIEQTWFKKNSHKNSSEPKQKKLMTSQQYDQKIKNMDFYDHWNQIDLNAVKFNLLKPDGDFKPFEFDVNQQQLKNIQKMMVQGKTFSQIYKNQQKGLEIDKRMFSFFQNTHTDRSQTKNNSPVKKIIFRGGNKFSNLQKQVNKKNS